MVEEGEGTEYGNDEYKDVKGLAGTITCTISMFILLAYLWIRG